jgi:hypothetical protein
MSVNHNAKGPGSNPEAVDGAGRICKCDRNGDHRFVLANTNSLRRCAEQEQSGIAMFVVYN